MIGDKTLLAWAIVFLTGCVALEGRVFEREQTASTYVPFLREGGKQGKATRERMGDTLA